MEKVDNMENMENKLTTEERIVKWNEERNLLKTPEEFNAQNDASFIQEELIEILTGLDSTQARPSAKLIVQAIASGNLNKLIYCIESNRLHVPTPESEENLKDITPNMVVDGFCDINVFSTGSIAKSGYNPLIAMDETLKEIETRVGEVKDGKFIKDKSPEAQARWYKADYNKAIMFGD